MYIFRIFFIPRIDICIPKFANLTLILKHEIKNKEIGIKFMNIEQELKELIIKSLELEDITPEDIKDEEPLFIEGLGLDSIDALELGMALKKQYNLKMSADKEENKKHFYSVKTLAEFIRSNKGE